MKEIKAIIRPERLASVLQALHEMPRLPGATVSHVRGFGRRVPADPRGESFAEVDMTKLELVVADDLVDEVVSAIERAASTGRAGDGKIFTLTVDGAVRVRSGERDLRAL
jgi:nitrogen regulatory protein P-II 1